MPVLEKLYEEYPDVEFIGINPFNKSEKIKKFVKIRKLKYPVFSVPGYEKKYNITGFPVVLIFDKNGNVIKRLEGYSDSHYDEIKKEIQENILK
jgi:thiol-disulfide isomerase/thioredoxin